MSKDRAPRRLPRKPLTGSAGPGDGKDPRYDRDNMPPRKPPRKTLQLCGQIAKTLEAVLSDQPDDVLRNLRVAHVEPAPDTTRLMVTVGPLIPGSSFDPALALQRLEAAAGELRAEVAASICRRRTPKLAFRAEFQPPEVS